MENQGIEFLKVSLGFIKAIGSWEFGVSFPWVCVERRVTLMKKLYLVRQQQRLQDTHTHTHTHTHKEVYNRASHGTLAVG